MDGVDLPEGLHACGDDFVDDALVGDISGHGEALLAGCPHLCDDGVRCLLVQVGDHHASTPGSHGQRRRPSDAAAGSGDQGDSIFEVQRHDVQSSREKLERGIPPSSETR